MSDDYTPGRTPLDPDASKTPSGSEFTKTPSGSEFTKTPSGSEFTKTQQILYEVDLVKDTMNHNIIQITNNMDNLVDLQDKVEDLEAESKRFHVSSTALKRRMWWKNTKLLIAIALIVIIILVIIIVSLASAFSN